jgi:serine O-acetyltransferase
VIHPNTTIGRGVTIGHNVTVSAGSQDPGSPYRVVLRDGVTLGAGCIVAARTGSALIVGEGAEVGAGAVVTRDVTAGSKMVGPKAVELPRKQE